MNFEKPTNNKVEEGEDVNKVEQAGSNSEKTFNKEEELEKINELIKNDNEEDQQKVKEITESLNTNNKETQKEKTKDDFREENIAKRIDNKFSDFENSEEITEITKKITEKIRNLPEEIKETYWQEMLALAKSDKDDIYFYKELHDDILEAPKLIQKNNELKNQELSPEERISKCDSFEDIDILLNNLDNLYGSESNYSSEDLKKIISDVKNFKAPLNTITRSGGLRNKVKSLISQPDAQKGIIRKEIQTAGGLQMWQIQRTPNPDLIRLNRGRSWELISESEYGELLREIKDKKISANIDKFNNYREKLFKFSDEDSERKEYFGEKMNSIRESLNNEFLLEEDSLDEIRKNLEILYTKTDIPLYKNFLDYINSSEDNFSGNQNSPLFKKISALKKRSNK